MRRASVLLVVALALTLAPSLPGTPQPAAAAAGDISAVVIEGTGYGHGRGMSQWGAYGWAVDQSKGWQWILDHYYGGTTLGNVNTAQARIKVRLLGFDGLTTVGVTSGSGSVTAGGVTRRSLYAKEISVDRFEIWGSSSMACPGAVALTVPNGPIARGASGTAVRQIQTFLNAFQSGTSLVVDGQFGANTEQRLREWQSARGITVDGRWDTSPDATSARAQITASGSAATWSRLTTVDGPVTFTTANGEVSSASPSSVLGVCDPAGKVTHYRGKIQVHNATSNVNWVVNDVTTEDYLRGVVPKEISASWADAGGGKGINAVRAQAVAARSYALVQNRYAPYASICDSQSCQVYFGSATRATAGTQAVNVEDARTDAAIVATVGKVRVNGGAVVATEFSASNGPRTAGRTFPSVDDAPGDATSKNPNHRWTRIIDADALAQRYGLGTVTSAKMVEAAAAADRLYDGIWYNDLRLTGSNGKTVLVTAATLRSSYNLPSPGFVARAVPRKSKNTTFAMIGDSVGNSIAGSLTSEFTTLIDGTFPSATLNMRDGRCIAYRCMSGLASSNGAEVAATLPMNLDLVVVELGYNQLTSGGMAADIDTMMRALAKRNVRQVAWVNLATAPGVDYYSAEYARRNDALLAARARWANLTVLDWSSASTNAESSRWFVDHAHLTATGQAEFALWLSDRTITPAQRLAPPERIVLPVVGQLVTDAGGVATTIPGTAQAVSLNITAVTPDAAGFITVWPCNQPRPATSNLNYSRRGIDNNGVIAPVDSNGNACFYSNVPTDFVVDITGWFGSSGGSGYVSATPYRAADSRKGIGVRKAKVVPSTPVEVQIAGLGVKLADGQPATIPADAVAAAINVTAVDTSAAGFITVWPCGVPKPVVSTLNFGARAIRGNGAIAPIGAGGKICVYSHVPTDVVIEVVGWFTAGSPAAMAAAVPDRWVDTRYGTGAPKTPVAPSKPLRIPAVGRSLTVGGSAVKVPATAAAMALNVVVVNPRAGGFATVWPCDAARPRTSSINFDAGAITSNNVIAPIAADGSICLYTNTPADVVVDVAGWLNGGSAFAGLVPDRLVDTRYGVGPAPG